MAHPMMQEALQSYSDDELALRVFNTEELYVLRGDWYELLKLLDVRFAYSQVQLRGLNDAIVDDEKPDELVEINSTSIELPPREILLECADASYGMGNRFVVDWERFYEHLESEGWDMQDLGGSVDNKIRRIVREAVKDGEVG